MLKALASGTLSGLCIAIGGTVYIACDSKYVGALLFSVALMTICCFGLALFTGKVGFLTQENKKSDFITAFVGLAGNALGCLIFGFMLRAALPELAEKCALIVDGKLEQTFFQSLALGYFCGVLMYIAVWIFKNKKSVTGIFVCIPTFILCGFEHSVADMFYIVFGGAWEIKALTFIAAVVAGNAAGALTIPLVRDIFDLENKKSNATAPAQGERREDIKTEHTEDAKD